MSDAKDGATVARVLTLMQPWGWLMIHGPKRIENRKWKPHASVMGQRILVHQGKKWDREGADYIELVLGIEFPDLAHAVGVLGSFKVDGYLTKGVDDCAPAQRPWFFGPYGWLTSEPEALPQPIPWRGALGLWKAPEELRRMIAVATTSGPPVTKPHGLAPEKG